MNREQEIELKRKIYTVNNSIGATVEEIFSASHIYYMNPKNCLLDLLIFLENSKGENQNFVNQMTGNFPLLAALFGLSSRAVTKTNGGITLRQQKISAIVLSCRLCSILDLSMIGRSWQVQCREPT